MHCVFIPIKIGEDLARTTEVRHHDKFNAEDSHQGNRRKGRHKKVLEKIDDISGNTPKHEGVLEYFVHLKGIEKETDRRKVPGLLRDAARLGLTPKVGKERRRLSKTSEKMERQGGCWSQESEHESVTCSGNDVLGEKKEKKNTDKKRDRIW